MSFLDIRFPESISNFAIASIEFSTSIASLYNKKEQRNVNWLNFRHKYNVNSGIKKYDDFLSLKTFFIIANGKGMSFKFKDLSNCTARKQILGIGDSNTKDYKFIKEYIYHGISFYKNYKKIIKDSVSVFINNQLCNSDTYEIDEVNGILKFLQAPKDGDTVYANFDFDIQVRFDTDIISMSVNAIQNKDFNFNTINDINLIEVED